MKYDRIASQLQRRMRHIESKKYGYIRVSSKDQNEERQRRVAMAEQRIPPKISTWTSSPARISTVRNIRSYCGR